jgi:hypothetical protein
LGEYARMPKLSIPFTPDQGWAPLEASKGLRMEDELWCDGHLLRRMS